MSELEIIQHQKISGISAFFDTVSYRTSHFHPEWELIWLLRGRLAVQCSRCRLETEAGELLLFSPNQIHEFRQLGEPATFLCLQVAPQSFEQICPELQAVTVETVRVDPYLTSAQKEILCGQLRELMQSYLDQEAFYSLHCASLCAAILRTLLTALPVRRMSEEERSSTDRRNARLSRFLQYVDENYMHKLGLADFAAEEGCSVGYLSHFLKQNLNRTFQDYVSTVRFHAACRMIRSGGMRMLDICEETGFSDYRYFSNTFKKQCGMTPEEYSRSAPDAAEQPRRKSIYSEERFYAREESYEILRTI